MLKRYDHPVRKLSSIKWKDGMYLLKHGHCPCPSGNTRAERMQSKGWFFIEPWSWKGSSESTGPNSCLMQESSHHLKQMAAYSFLKISVDAITMSPGGRLLHCLTVLSSSGYSFLFQV